MYEKAKFYVICQQEHLLVNTLADGIGNCSINVVSGVYGVKFTVVLIKSDFMADLIKSKLLFVSKVELVIDAKVAKKTTKNV